MIFLCVLRWLKTNGEAIYKTKPWTHQNDTLTSEVWYTSRNIRSDEESVEFTNVFAIVLNYPYKTNSVLLGAFNELYTDIVQITMLGFNTSLKVS